MKLPLTTPALRKTAAVVACLVFSACAKKQVTRAEWLQMSSHTFKDTNVEEVMLTGEKVLQLCDGSDVKFSHAPNRMIGDRYYLIYAVLAASFGHYIFDLSATQKGNDVVAQLLISESQQGVTGVPVVGGAGVAPMTGPVQGNPISDRAAYDLLFSRMDSLLYDKPWMACGVARARFGWGPVESLCLNADDDIPPGVRVLRLDKKKARSALKTWTASKD